MILPHQTEIYSLAQQLQAQAEGLIDKQELAEILKKCFVLFDISGKELRSFVYVFLRGLGCNDLSEDEVAEITSAIQAVKPNLYPFLGVLANFNIRTMQILHTNCQTLFDAKSGAEMLDQSLIDREDLVTRFQIFSAQRLQSSIAHIFRLISEVNVQEFDFTVFIEEIEGESPGKIFGVLLVHRLFFKHFDWNQGLVAGVLTGHIHFEDTRPVIETAALIEFLKACLLNQNPILKLN